MHAFRSDPSLFPLLMESLIVDPLWTFITPIESQDPNCLPQCDLITCEIENFEGETRKVVPLFSKDEFAEEFRIGWNPQCANRLRILHYGAGRHALDKLGQRNLNLVIDHGHHGTILQASVWRPAYAKYGKGRAIAAPQAPLPLFSPADPDDFPLFRDRISSLLLRLPDIKMGWLMWVPAAGKAPPQLCLITASMGTFEAARIRAALSLLADDLVLPALAYLPLAFGTKEIGDIPARAPMFYSDEIARLCQHSLRGAQRR